jgi:purine-binding chemotaxis protein CheW
MTLRALPAFRLSRAAPQKVEPMSELVGFRIGPEDFGADILMVQEIIRLPEVTPLPNAPAFILGVINLRGRILPVVDLRQRLKIPGKQPEIDRRKTRILIVEVDGHLTGFIVDAALGILKVPTSEIEPTPDLLASSIDAEFIRGVIKLPGRLVILLDFQRILKPQEKKELSEFEMHGMGEDSGQEES